MNRVIKFRAWDESRKKMVYEFTDKGWGKKYRLLHDEEGGKMLCGNYMDNGDWQEPELMQFTGLHDKNGKEIYEGDIFRLEESTDGPDRVFYLVITWVQEWCMFCTLRVDEYEAYLAEGIESLDEPMFWQYTLEGTNDRKYFLCGDIYRNPELLKA